MRRSLSFKLTAAMLLVMAMLMTLLTSLEYDSFIADQTRRTQAEMRNELSRLFSSQNQQQEETLREHPFSDLAITGSNRQIDGVVCEDSGATLWQDIRPGQLKAVNNLCQQLQALHGDRESDFRLGAIQGAGDYYLYSLRFTRFLKKPVPRTFNIVLLRPASELMVLRNYAKWSIIRRAVLIYAGFALLLLWTTRWGLGSLTRMQRQLDEIRQQRRSQLSQDFEQELLPLTSSLNELLANERQQTQRYQNSMNDLAHSLKTRLALIQATMAEEQLSNGARRNLDDQVQLMDQIIQYHLRRAVTGRQLLSNKGCDPVPVVQKLLATMAKVYQHKRILLRFEHDDALSFAGEPDDLFELMGNLLDNAHKFAISEIHLALRQQAQWLQITLEDDGPGISPSQREQVLKRGVRADSSNGQGIGLSVCSEIIASYQGAISISDSELGGACFTLLLPSAAE